MLELLWFIILATRYVHCRHIPNLSSITTDHPDVENIVNDLFKNIKTKQSVVFSSNETIPESQGLIKALSNKTSNYVLDIETVKNGKDKRLINLKFFAYPRHSTMYFILKKANNNGTFDEMKDFLRDVSDLSPVVTRPRCLLILYGRIRGMARHLYDKAIRNFLDYAWSLKFLDLKIAHFISWDHPIIFYLNPYRNEFFKFRYDQNSTSTLFPKKLVDAKNYTINNYILSLTNATCIYRDKNGEIEMYILPNHDWFIYLKHFLAYTNIKIHWDVVWLPLMVTSFLGTGVLKMLSQNEVSSSSITFFHSGNSSMVRGVETSRFFEYVRFDLYVPPITTSKFQFPWEIFETALSFAATVFLYFTASRIIQWPGRLPRTN